MWPVLYLVSITLMNLDSGELLWIFPQNSWGNTENSALRNSADKPPFVFVLYYLFMLAFQCNGTYKAIRAMINTCGVSMKHSLQSWFPQDCSEDMCGTRAVRMMQREPTWAEVVRGGPQFSHIFGCKKKKSFTSCLSQGSAAIKMFFFFWAFVKKVIHKFFSPYSCVSSQAITFWIRGKNNSWKAVSPESTTGMGNVPAVTKLRLLY